MGNAHPAHSIVFIMVNKMNMVVDIFHKYMNDTYLPRRHFVMTDEQSKVQVAATHKH